MIFRLFRTGICSAIAVLTYRWLTRSHTSLERAIKDQTTWGDE